MNSKLIDEILSYSGQGGLREFLRRHENQAISILVEDPFIRLDADTLKDLSLLREMMVSKTEMPKHLESICLAEYNRICAPVCSESVRDFLKFAGY